MSVLSLSKNYFKTLLELAVKDVLYLLNGISYSQVDGIGMGPTLANALLCHHEKNWLKDMFTFFSLYCIVDMLMTPFYCSVICLICNFFSILSIPIFRSLVELN